MGLLKAGIGALSGVLADQWRDYFYCESIPEEVLVTKGQKRVNSRRSSNTKGEENVISNGSIVAINEGQFMIIVDQGKIVEFSDEPGQFVYDTSSEPSLFYGSFGESLLESFKNVGKRFSFGGDAGKDQRVYYFNKKEIMGNKYGTPNPVPFRVVDKNIGLDIDISIRCHGEYSYRIIDPLLFYTNVSGNVQDDFKRARIDSQLKTELMTALQPAFAKISAMGIRYSSLPGHTIEMSEALNEVLSQKWSQLRGIAIASFGVSSVKASDEDENMIKQLQRSAVMRDPTMAAASLVGAQSEAMVHAAKNQGAGPMMAFAGMNMAQGAGGMNAGQLFAMGQQQPQTQQAQSPQQGGWACECGKENTGRFCAECGKPKPEPKPAEGQWACSCGASNTGKFCAECGSPKPAEKDGWACECGAQNKGRFCPQCGKPKPAGEKTYQCDKCGWEPDDKQNPPKFCPECGDIFDEGDASS